MLTYALRKELFDSIPTSFTVTGPDGSRTFNTVSKRYANQYIETQPTPAIVLEFTRYNIGVLEPLGQWRKATTVTTDTFTKQTGVDTYTLTISPADQIYSVYATVGGVKHQLISSSNYTLSNNQITFIGPTYPDDGTDFTVKYNHQLFRKFKGGEFADVVSINVYADDYRDSATSYFYPGTVISEQIADQLYKWFEYTFNDDEMMTYPVSQIRDLDFLASPEQTQWKRRRQFDVRIVHAVEIEIQVETIETVEHTEQVVP